MNADLATLLASGAVGLTPNQRLSRHLHQLFDARQRAAGLTVWATPTILPYRAWVESLWRAAVAADAVWTPPRLVTSSQAAYLWRSLVADEESSSNLLLDRRGAAELALEAWTLLHAWGAGGASWRGWNRAELSDDVATFMRWAESYSTALARRGAIDGAQLADALIPLLPTLLPSIGGWAGAPPVIMIGFGLLSPQQQRLLDALRTAGARVTSMDAQETRSASIRRTTGRSKRDELARALGWARSRAQARPNASIAVVVEDLGARRNEVRALAEDLLCPSLQWPGAEDTPRPYNISLGDSLADVPLVASALDLLTLCEGELSLAAAATLVRSPFIAGAADRWAQRAAGEQRWLNEGRSKLRLRDVIATLAIDDGALAERWRRAFESQPRTTRGSPREWTQRWRTQLATFGWPGDRPLSSAEYQASRAWDELLVAFAAIEAIDPRLGRQHALTALHAMAREQLFQPETATAPIQILGLLEAAGLPFDAVWVAGLAAEVWPRAPRANPLLPLRWQQERNVPRATAASELAFASRLTTQFMHAAPEVVFSHPAIVDDQPRSVSALIAALPVDDIGAVGSTSADIAFAQRPQLQWLDDEGAPEVAAGTRMSGGAALIEKQSDCPFRAVAIHRLRADRWPDALAGLTPIERGNLAHRALAAFWREGDDHASLLMLTSADLQRRLDVAVAVAIDSTAVRRSRWESLPAILAAGESRRLSRLLRDEIDELERGRPPFIVREVEVGLELELAQMRFGLRADRIDALAGGGVAIIDYKTGRALAPARWFDRRPQAPQLPLYALALSRRRDAVAVRALAYAQVKPGHFRLLGLAADAAAWPPLAVASALNLPDVGDWASANAHWTRALEALAGEIARGHAAVDPRDKVQTCARCRLHAFCRIGVLDPASLNAAALDDATADESDGA